MSASTATNLWRKNARKAALIGLAGAVIVGWRQPDQFYRSYLFAYLLCLGLSLGCIGLLLLHSLVGGEWGKSIRPILESGADAVPWLALLFVPLLIGVKRIYPWTDPAHFAESAAAAHKLLYFSLPFFIGRAAVYFALWFWIGRRQQQTPGRAAAALIIFILTVSFSSFDWAMSLEPLWSSSIYGAIWVVGDALGALALATLVLARLGQTAEETAHDLGNLLLAFVMLWAYVELSQFLIIWYGNLPEEIGWYLARQRGGWLVFTIGLFLLQFALPFILLLARQRKRKLASLGRVAALVLALRVADAYWLTAPDFTPGHFSIRPLDLLLLMGVGGASAFAFFRNLQRSQAA